MIIKSIRSGFYDLVRARSDRVLVVASSDTDGLCAADLFVHALHNDDVPYSIVVVDGRAQLKQALQEHKWARYVVLLGCGGGENLIEYCDPDEAVGDTQFFVVDSRRPLSVENVYAVHVQVVVADDDEQQLDIPDRHIVIDMDEESDEEDENDEPDADDSDEDVFGDSDEPREKKRHTKTKPRRSPEQERRRKDVWRDVRERKMDEYLEYEYRQTPCSLTIFRLLEELSLVTSVQSWTAIVGATSHYADGHWSRGHFDTTDELRHCANLARTIVDDNDTGHDRLVLKFAEDLTLPLYRHWSVVTSIKHSQLMFSALKLWTREGDSTLLKFIARVGITRKESEQMYESMHSRTREKVRKLVEDQASEYHIDPVNLTRGEYTARCSYSASIGSVDMAAVVAAIAHMHNDGVGADSTRWQQVRDALHRPLGPSCKKGIELSKAFMCACVRETSAALERNHAVPMHNIISLPVQLTADARLFGTAHGLVQFGRFFRDTFISTARGRRFASRTLLVTMPVDMTEPHGWQYVCGVPPLDTQYEAHPTTILPLLLELAAKKVPCQFEHDFFDRSIIRIRAEDKQRFFDSLVMHLPDA